MYQQGIGNGNIYCHCQPENLNKRNFLGFMSERGARNQCTGPAAQQAECVQFVFWDTVLVFVFTSDFARGLHRRLLVLLIEDEGGDTDKDVNEKQFIGKYGDNGQENDGDDTVDQECLHIDIEPVVVGWQFVKQECFVAQPDNLDGLLAVAFHRAVAVETDALPCLRTAGIVMVRTDVEENILGFVAETDEAVAFGIVPCGNRTAHNLIGRQQILLGGFRSGITGFGNQRLLDLRARRRSGSRTR